MMKIAIAVVVALLVTVADAGEHGICKPKTDLYAYFFNCCGERNISSIPDITQVKHAEKVDMMFEIMKCINAKLGWFDGNNQLNQEGVMESIQTLSTVSCLQTRLTTAFEGCLNVGEIPCEGVSTTDISKQLCLWRQHNAICEIDDHGIEKKNCDYDPKLFNDLIKLMFNFTDVVNQMAKLEKERGSLLSDTEKAELCCPVVTNFMDKEGCIDETGLNQEKTCNFFETNIVAVNETIKATFMKKVNACFEEHKDVPKEAKPCAISFCCTGVFDKVCKINETAQETAQEIAQETAQEIAQEAI